MSFGWSAGDILAAVSTSSASERRVSYVSLHSHLFLELVVQVSNAIKDKGGAASKYQHVQLELRALQTTLQRLLELEPNHPSNACQLNAIRGVALACTIPLREFLDKIQRFESSLGPFARPGSFSISSAARKSQYGLFFAKEVSELRAVVAGKVISINILLGMQIMYATFWSLFEFVVTEF